MLDNKQQNSEIISILLDRCLTVADRNDLKKRILKIKSDVYTVKFKFEEKLKNEVYFNEFSGLIKLAEKMEVNISNKAEINDFLIYIVDLLDGLEVVEIELAVLPQQIILESIIDWFEINLKKRIILNININPELIGGVVLKLEGRSLDYSLKRNIEELMK